MTGVALAIELSQREGSIALGDGAHAPVVRMFASGRSSDDDALMPAIDATVREAGLRPRDIGVVAVSIGPGGFTGVRIAVTTAKLLAECLEIPLVGVPSSLVAAAGAAGPGPYAVALASKRDTTWLTEVEGETAQVRIRGVPSVVDATSFERMAKSAKTLLADEYVPEPIVALARRNDLFVERPIFRADRCLSVGLAMLVRGEISAPAALLPLYPREPEAVALWRDRHG